MREDRPSPDDFVICENCGREVDYFLDDEYLCDDCANAWSKGFRRALEFIQEKGNA
jgi:predicted amidophosphoribosyltransferase